MKFLIKIVLLFVVALSLTEVKAQANDTLTAVNEEYKNILFNDSQFLDVLFYKHYNNMQLNNLGPYGSSYYYVTNYLQDNQSTVFAPTDLRYRLLSLSGFSPFTNITWINAGRREQLLSVNHIQKFGKLADISISDKRISSPGIYVNQEV